MSDYVSREAVLTIVEDIKENKDAPKNYGTLLDIARQVRALPAVKPSWLCGNKFCPQRGETASVEASVTGEDTPVTFDLDKVIEKMTEKQLSVQEMIGDVEEEEIAVMLRGQLRGISDCLEIIKEAQK